MPSSGQAWKGIAESETYYNANHTSAQQITTGINTASNQTSSAAYLQLNSQASNGVLIYNYVMNSHDSNIGCDAFDTSDYVCWTSSEYSITNGGDFIFNGDGSLYITKYIKTGGWSVRPFLAF